LDETQDADKKLLLASNMNSTAMCCLSLSLTDKVSQMVLYNGRTIYLTSKEAATFWRKLIKLFQSKNGNKMNELKGEFVKRTLSNEKTNPVEWFADLMFIHSCLEED
jgi:Mor family transcriptional regulator